MSEYEIALAVIENRIRNLRASADEYLYIMWPARKQSPMEIRERFEFLSERAVWLEWILSEIKDPGSSPYPVNSLPHA